MVDFKRHGQITSAEVYLEDNSLVGIVSEFSIPEIAWNTIDHETLGQVAIFKAPARPLQALEGSMKWQFVEPSLAAMAYNPTKVYPFQLHSKVDIMGPDGFDQDNSYTLVTLVALQFHKASFGAAKLGDLMDTDTEFTCVRMTQKIHDSDTELFSVDVFANTVKAGGSDIWKR